MNDNIDEENESACPFCGSQDNCEHLLLLVDKTFRTADGGVLMNAFNKRWCAICNEGEEDEEDEDDEGGNDFDESEAFDELLDEIDFLADTSIDYDHEGGPGTSSTYVIYFVESEAKAQNALARFTARGERFPKPRINGVRPGGSPPRPAPPSPCWPSPGNKEENLMTIQLRIAGDHPYKTPNTCVVLGEAETYLDVSMKFGEFAGMIMRLTKRADGRLENENGLVFVQVKGDRRPKPYAVTYRSVDGSHTRKFATIEQVTRADDHTRNLLPE